MRIIRPHEFKIIEDVRLNRGGKVIGQIVRYKGEYYYKSFRTDAHFFKIFRGFGIDSTLFMKLLDKKFNAQLQEKLGINKYMKGIIIEYCGKKEHRFYFADFDTWFLKSTPYGTAKVTDENVESYGRQYILARKLMTVIGFAEDDYEVNRPKELKKFL